MHESGGSYIHLSPLGEHPARYVLYRADRSNRVRVYIWNLTRGGNHRPPDEWRVQATGLREGQFEAEQDGKTLILGWHRDRSLLVGFDFARHRNRLGSSPSIQIREKALERAALNGFSLHRKGNEELAIAFRPEFFATYAENLEALHACGEIDQEFDLLNRIADSAGEIDEEEVVEKVAEVRRSCVVSVTRKTRAGDFSRRVGLAYGHRCAMCGVQLRLLDGAHILPVEHHESVDSTNNGVALCATHHRAYDRALVAFDPDLRVGLNAERVAKLRADGRDGGLARFQSSLSPRLSVPNEVRDRPSERFVKLANQVRGWDQTTWLYVGGH